MNTIQKTIIDYLKKTISFLERKWNKVTIIEASPIHSLAPKILTDKEEIEKIQPYLNHLKQAIDTESINNIAITGSYGSGKSTILKTFQYFHKDEYKFLNVSLASFKETNEHSFFNLPLANKGKDDDFERRLEISILQQMFYHVKPSEVPDSRFKRIVNLKSGRLFFLTAAFILWILCSLILFRFDFIEKLNPSGWRISDSVNWVGVSSSIIFFIGIGLFIKNIYRIFRNSKINKINIKGELELGESIDKSVFNQHLEEILYFFEKTKVDVVVIEDVDRFNSTDIFTKLREINILINNAKPIYQPVKFIYAIKDEMFKDKNERVKFFEFIIPVISFINPSNANEQLTKLITNAKLENVLSADFTSDVVTFIDDIDMRLLINIFHEYQLYKSLLSSDFDQESLFAIIVYKNLYPEDFGHLKKRQGKLFDFFNNKAAYSKSIIDGCNAKIKEIDEKISLLENEIEKPIKELRAVYIIKLVSKFDKFHAFYVKNEDVSIDEALETKYFNEIKNAKGIVYTLYNSSYNSYEATPSSPQDTKITFSEIEKEISSKLTYNQREKLLIERANNQINTLKLEKAKLRDQISETEFMSVRELFEKIDVEEHLGCFKENNLMRNLLLNGYINEHYNDYISLFHGVSLTQEDFVFEQKVKSGQSTPFDYIITQTENLIKHLPDQYFRKVEIYNYKVFSFLLDNEDKYSVKLDYFLQGLGIDEEKQFEFIHSFIKSKPENIAIFIKKLCEYKPGLWEYIHVKSGVTEDEIRALLKHIFDYADKGSILKFSSLVSLEKYVSKMNDFFDFCSTLNRTDTIQTFVIERNIAFDNIDLPNEETQKEIFNRIYTKNLYQLNQHNIFSIIKGNGEIVDEAKLNIAHYTTLLKTGLKDLLDYINDNIEDYIEQVMLLAEDNTEEDEKTIVDILNREDVGVDLKNQLVRSQKTKITSLESINDINSKQIVLENNKIIITWHNVFDYYDATKEAEFDNILISFLNEEENYNVLSKKKISNDDKDEGYIESVSGTLIQSEALKIGSYSALLLSLPYRYKKVNFEMLSLEKIDALLSKKILNLTTDNFDGLKSKGNNLHIKLIEIHQTTFIEKMEKLSLDSDDWLLVFKSDVISITNKRSIIKDIDESIIISNNDIADTVCSILPSDQYVALSYEVLSAMFDVHESLSKKVALLNLNFDTLSDNQIQVLTEKLGKDYKRIFIKQNKPIFKSESYLKVFFDKLKAKDLIIRYEKDEDKNEFKVFAKY